MEVESLYQNRFAGTATLSKKNDVWKVLCSDFFQAWVPKNALVVDVAAGYCEFLNNIVAREKIGFDLNPDTKKFAASDVRIINKSCLSLDGLADGSVDVFFVSNFLEHLNTKEEALQLFQNVFKKTKTGGKVLILQPNLKLVGGVYWDFLDHKLPWTEGSLMELAKMTGFHVKHCLKRFLPYSTKSRLPQAPVLVSLYLKMLPLSGWFFGKQTFIVFEK